MQIIKAGRSAQSHFILIARVYFVILLLVSTHCTSTANWLQPRYTSAGILESHELVAIDSPWRIRLPVPWRYVKSFINNRTLVIFFQRPGDDLTENKQSPRCIIHLSANVNTKVADVLEKRHGLIVAEYHARGWYCKRIRRDILFDIQKHVKMTKVIGISYECRNEEQNQKLIIISFAGEYNHSMVEVTIQIDQRHYTALRREFISILGSLSYQ